MEFPELSVYKYNIRKPLDGVFAVGWIGSSRGYHVGDVSQCIKDKLAEAIVRERVNQTRGSHYCEFCSAEEVVLWVGNQRKFLGSSEVWIPDHAGGRVFAAPNLIHHYIAEHRYQPPVCFLDAVEAFEFDSDWSGQRELERLLSRET